MKTLLEYVIFLSLAVAVISDNCLFPSQSSTSQDLQKQLQRLDSLRNTTFVADYEIDKKNLKFKFQLCGVPSSACTNLPNTAIVVEMNGECNGSIGMFNNSFISSGSNWVSMTFSGGNRRNVLQSNTTLPQESTITFICDSKSKEGFSLVYTNRDKAEEQWHYSFVLNTDRLCDKPLVGGLSGGSVFCIIFFTVAGVYFLFGFLYRRFVVRAKGVEQIPNYDVWKEFGNLIADGCDYMCRCGTRQEAKMYQGIGDPLGNESESEERDDRLLPM